MVLQFFGQITPPSAVPTLGGTGDTDGLINLLNIVLKLVFVVAGLWSLWNLILAGYLLIAGGVESSKLERVRGVFIWTFLGIVIMISAVLVAGLIGYFVYNNWSAVLNPKFK